MTIHGNRVIGLKVYTLRQGKHIDKVGDILFDPLTQKVAGLLVGPKRFLAEDRAIPLTAVRQIGPDAVLVEDDRAIRPASDLPARLAHLSKGDDQLVNNHIISQSGTDLGYIYDLLFDFPSGQIESFEVAPKSNRSDTSARSWVTPTDILTIGPDATIVSQFKTLAQAKKDKPAATQGPSSSVRANTAEDRTASVGAAYAAIATRQPAIAGTLGGETSRTATATRQTTAETTAESSQSRIAASPTQMMSSIPTPTMTELATRELRVAQAVGAYLTKNLVSPIDDSLLAKRGDMVTYSLIDQAHQLGIDQQIFSHISEAPVPDHHPAPDPHPLEESTANPNRAKKPLFQPAPAVESH